MAGRPIKKTHLCVASSIRALPENEKPPARPVDVYCLLDIYDRRLSECGDDAEYGKIDDARAISIDQNIC